LAAEVATEIRLLKVLQAELAAHAAERETRYQQVDPAALARSLPGLADVGGPALTACMGDPARFATGKRFRSFTGLTPKASETGETDRKGQPISKGISDVTADDGTDPRQLAEDEYWVGCGGMLTQQQYRDLLLEAGFTGIIITSTHEAGPGLHSAIVNAAKPAASHT
jgi:hypothetical protein